MKKISNRGFTLIEAIFSVTIFTVVVLGAYQAYRALLVSAQASAQRLAALEIASTEIERARSKAYADVLALPTQTILRNGLSYRVVSSVVYADDPFDGVAPADASPEDYKELEIRVECDSCRNFSPVILNGRFAP